MSVNLMRRASDTDGAHRNGILASGISARNSAPDFDHAEEQIRVLLRSHLPHGEKTELGRITGQQLRHVSAQLSGESGLRHKTVQAGIFLLRLHPDLEAAASAIRLIRDGADGFDLVETTGLVIELGGQLLLPGIGR